MKRSIVKGLITVSVASFTFFSCSKHDIAHSKNYQDILYGSAPAETTINNPTTVIHTRTAKKAEPVLIDTTRYLALQELSLFTDSYYNGLVAEKVNLFYRTNKLQSKWLYDSEPSALYYTLLNTLRQPEAYGLTPDYNTDEIEKAVESVYTGEIPNAQDVMALDVRITELYFLFTTHLSEGKVRQVGHGNKLWLRDSFLKSVTDASDLAEAKTEKELLKVIDRAQPENDQYKRLQAALSYYRDLERYAVEVLPAANVNGKIEPGMRHKSIPLIRKRLSQFDLKVYPTTLDSISGQWDTLLYDQGLVQGIVAFQIVHGLEPDGVIGPMTVTYLNKSLHSRVEAIAVNMDRMRWTPVADKEGEYILVNIPEYKLRIYDKDKQVFEMRVIVGAIDNPTPVFNDKIEHVVFSPTWTVPVSIIKNEIIPRLKSNPDYYTEKNYVFYKNGEQIDPSSEAWGTTSPGSYRIVQQPGGDNSLGRVKFGMNNSMRIYLHDTPSQRLFSKDYRALSHGCIRLDEPAKFAEYLLRDHSGWDKDRINKQMFSGTASTVILKRDYPVHVQYCTAWVDEYNQVNFREDIYGHDRMQVQELNKPSVKPTGAIAGL